VIRTGFFAEEKIGFFFAFDLKKTKTRANYSVFVL